MMNKTLRFFLFTNVMLLISFFGFGICCYSDDSISHPQLIGCSSYIGEEHYDDFVTFTAIYTGNGEDSLTECGIYFTPYADTVTNFTDYTALALYDVSQDKLYVAQTAVVGQTARRGGITPGSAGLIENMCIKLDCAETKVTKNGSEITIQWRIKFTLTKYTSDDYLYDNHGSESIYLYANDKVYGNTGYVQCFTWVILPVYRPVIENLSPGSVISSAGEFKDITVVYSSRSGIDALGKCGILVYADNYTAGGYYDPTTDIICVRTNDGEKSASPGEDIILSNMSGGIDCSSTTVTKTDTTITINWKFMVSQKPGSASVTYPIMVYAEDVYGFGYDSKKGTWAVDWDPAGGIPTIEMSQPCAIMSHENEYMNIVMRYTDTSQVSAIKECYCEVSGIYSWAMNELLFYYDAVTNKLYAMDEYFGNWMGGITPGASDFINTPYGTLDCSRTNVTRSGKTITINWCISLKNIMSSVSEEEYGNEVGWPSWITGRAVNETGGDSWYVEGGTWLIIEDTPPSPWLWAQSGMYGETDYIDIGESMTYETSFAVNDKSKCSMMFSNAETTNGVTVTYDTAANTITLIGKGEEDITYSLTDKDQGRKYISNRFAVLDCSKTYVDGRGGYREYNIYDLYITISFKKIFSGKKDIYGQIVDTNESITEKLGGITILAAPLFVNIDTSTADEIIVNNNLKDGLTVYKNGAKPEPFHNLTPEMMLKADVTAAGSGDLVIDFGQGYGVWMRSTSGAWTILHSASPDNIVKADMDGNGKDELLMDFNGYGLSALSYSKETGSVCSLVHGLSPRGMASGDIDNDNKDEVVIDFGVPYGIWIYNYGQTESWSKLHSTSCDDMVIYDSDNNGCAEITIDFGEQYGLWRAIPSTYLNSMLIKWLYLHYISPKLMEKCDIDGDGREDIVIDFMSETTGQEYGIYALNGTSGWSLSDYKLTVTWNYVHKDAAHTICAGIFNNGAESEELLIDFGPQYDKWLKTVYDMASGSMQWVQLK